MDDQARLDVGGSSIHRPDADADGDAPDLRVDDEIRGRYEAVDATRKFDLEPFPDIDLDLGRQWLIKGLMPATGLHVLYGAPGTGKSFLALNAALHVASGLPWGGRSVRRSGVVYIASEGGRNFRKRVCAAKKALVLPEDAQFALVTTAPIMGGAKADTKRLIAEIREQTKALGWEPKLIVLDTLSRSIDDLNESSSQDVMDFVKNAELLGQAFKATVMPVHHCGKDESKGMRGSSALHGSADAEWMVARDPESGVRRMTVEKMKDGPDKDQLRYDLVDVPLGFDEDGEPIGSCVAKVFEAQPDEKDARPARAKGVTQEESVLVVLKLLAALEGRPAPEDANLPAGSKIVARSRVLDTLILARVLASPNPASVRKALNRALEALAKRGVLTDAGEDVCLPAIANEG